MKILELLEQNIRTVSEVIRRKNIQIKLKNVKIPTAVHYLMPLHIQECFEYLEYKKGDFSVAEKVSKEIMSIPMNLYLTDSEINFIVKEV